jgi:hypothetical protein
MIYIHRTDFRHGSRSRALPPPPMGRAFRWELYQPQPPWPDLEGWAGGRQRDQFDAGIDVVERA